MPNHELSDYEMHGYELRSNLLLRMTNYNLN